MSTFRAASSADIPLRLDRLPWSRWHLLVAVALGITWLLDGLEGSLGGSLAGALKQSSSQGGLGFTDAQLGLSSSLYLVGAVVGALTFGYMADRLGRRRLFFWTLALYVCATAATSLAWNLSSFTFCRILTGAGIGGEYAAINSAVDELMPARLRGRIDLWINGTFWLGIILGSLVTVSLLSHPWLAHVAAWRTAFWSGVPIALCVLLMRRVIPESPRWLLARGEHIKAEQILAEIEAQVERPNELAPQPAPASRFASFAQETSSQAPHPDRGAGLSLLFSPRFRARSALCLILMIAQAFFYNSVFFSLSLVLLRFYSASAARVGYYFLPIAVANFLGPVLLGRLFDTVGRRRMIGTTYCLSGFMLLVTSLLFLEGRLTLTSQTLMWAGMFFFASTAASSAYLTVGEIFPQEFRATAIALFYAVGTLTGGASGPLIFGKLVGTGQRGPLVIGYLIGAVGMIFAGLMSYLRAIDAEGKSLEELARN